MVVLFVAAVWSGWWWVTALRLATDRPQTAIATVEYLHEEFPLEPWLLPGALEMSFVTTDGRRVVTDILHGDPAPAEGDTVGIEYAAGHPSAAAIPGDPGLERGLWVSGAVAALALTRLVWCGVTTGRILRRLLRAARRGQTRPFDYLLLPGGEEPGTEAPMLVLFEPGAQRPTSVMDVVPSAVLLPPEGSLELRSVPQDPVAAVAWIGEEPVWPTSPLTVLDEDGGEGVPPGVRGGPRPALRRTRRLTRTRLSGRVLPRQVTLQAHLAHHRPHLGLGVGDPEPGPLSPGSPGGEEQRQGAVRTEMRHPGHVDLKDLRLLAQSCPQNTAGVLRRAGVEVALEADDEEFRMRTEATEQVSRAESQPFGR